MDADSAVAGVLGQATPVAQLMDADAAVAKVIGTNVGQVRNNIQNAVNANPEQTAKYKYLGEYLGVPIDTVRAQPDVIQAQAAMQQMDAHKLVTQYPKTANLLTDRTNAEMLHDDVPNTAAIEGAVRSIAPQSSVWDDIKGMPYAFVQNLGGAFNRFGTATNTAIGAFPVAGDTINSLIAGRKKTDMQDAYFARFVDPGVNNDAAFQLDQNAGFGEKTAHMLGGVLGMLSQMTLTGGGAATVAVGEQTAMQIATQAVEHGVKSMVAPATSDAVNRGREVYAETGNSASAVRAALTQYGVTSAMGVVPLSTPGGMAARLSTGFLSGATSGEVSRGVMNSVLPAQMQTPFNVDDLILSGLAGAVMGGVMGPRADPDGLHAAVRATYNDVAKADAAQTDAGKLQALGELATASKFRERDPQGFRQFVENVTEDGHLSDVYIDSKTLVDTLNQSGITLDQLRAKMPEVADQLVEATETKGDVRIPVADYATHMAGGPIGEGLLEHLKTTPDGMTYSEMQVYQQKQVEQMQQTVDKLVAEKQAGSEQTAQADAVEAHFKDQLAQANRFTPEVNTSYAKLMREYFSTMAARMGLTPTEMLARYPLQARAEALAGADRTLEQPAVDEATNLPLNADGTVTLYHHTDAASAVKIRETGTLKAEAEPAVYFTTVKDATTGYGDTAVPVRVDPKLLKIDDEFPDGRRDFSVDTGKPGGTLKVKVDSVFDQSGTEKPNAQIAFAKDIKSAPSVISLFDTANLSSFLHEAGHFFLEVQSDLAAHPDAPDSVKSDMQKTMDWFGVKDAEAWRAMSSAEKVDAHEKFARGFEAYLMTGKAPSLELRTMFRNFRAWLVNVYRSIKNLNVKLSPEMRGVFDRMLASEDVIKQTEAARGMVPLFDVKPDTMSDAEYAAYQDLGRESTATALDTLESRSLRDMRWLSNAKSEMLRELQKQADGLRNDIRATVAKEVMAEPVNRARTWLRKGEMVDEKGTLIKAEKGFRLNSDTVKEMYPDTALDHPDLAGLRGVTAKDGLHPDIVAEMFGFRSGDDLIRNILTGEKPKEKIDGITDQRMLEEHGDLSDAPSIERAAEEAIHNEARARFVATELKALAKATGPARLLAKAAQEAADAAVAAKRIRELRPAQYTAAESRAAKASTEALAKGDVVEAAQQKRAQLLNNRLVRAAADAVAEIRKDVQYLKKFDKPSIREKLNGEFLSQIDAIRGRIDPRQNPPDGPNKAQQSLEKWAQGLRDAGYEPQIADWLTDLQTPTHYKDLTVEQLRGAVSSIKSLEHIARERQNVLVNSKQVALDEVVQGLVTRMEERGPKFTKAELLEPPRVKVDGYFKALTHWLGTRMRLINTDLKPQEFKFNTYDLHELDGPFREALLDPILEANYSKVDMTKAASDMAGKVGDALGKDWQKSLYDLVDNDRLVDPDLSVEGQPPVPMKITRGRMLGIARHVGNESNFDRLTKGYGWSPGDVWRFLDQHMTDKDWKATQAHWDSFDPLWKKTEGMVERLGGVPPPKIPAREFDTRFGKMRGGYSPLDYDPIRSKLSVKQGELDLGPGDRVGDAMVYKATTTTNGSLIRRAEGYTDRVNLDFHSAEARIRDTIHDLAYREALINANKVISDPKFREAFLQTYGREEYKALNDWLKDIRDMNAVDPRTRNFDRAMQYTRQGVVITGIGYRMSTVLKHGVSAGLKSLGYLGTGEGAKFFAARVARMGSGHRSEDIAAAKEKFAEIRTRALQMDRDYKQGNRSMYEAEGWMAKNDRFGHSMVAWSDLLSAVPTAWAAYDLAITSGVPKSMGGTGKPMTEDAAVRYANSIVRQAHGSALEVTRSNFMQARGAKGFFGALYGFMNNTYGQMTDMFDKSVSGGYFRNNPAVAGRLFATLIVPALWTEFLKDGLPKIEDAGTWVAKAMAGEVGATVPFVRDAVSILERGHGGVIAPMQALTDVANSGHDIWKESQGESSRIIQDLSNAIGEWAHISGLGQLGHILQYARDVAEGKKQPESTAQAVKQAVIGGH